MNAASWELHGESGYPFLYFLDPPGNLFSEKNLGVIHERHEIDEPPAAKLQKMLIEFGGIGKCQIPDKRTFSERRALFGLPPEFLGNINNITENTD